MKTGTIILTAGVVAAMAGTAHATATDVVSFQDAPRLFNDFGGSNLSYGSDFNAGTLSIVENNYGSGNFANRHVGWFADGGGNKVDFDYGDAFKISTTLTINQADNVGNVEAGIQADLFGFGLFGVLTGNGEIAAFGSTNQFFSFGTGLYNVGDAVMLEMTYAPGAGEFATPVSQVQYRYNNMTQGSGWVSSGFLDITNSEGGIPSFFDQFYGLGAQINQPDSATGAVDIQFTGTTVMVPAPATLALLGLAGVCARRRR
ncbi:MAG: PEP-CTERM sorting domain-containing protein [Planctomycetota bacterium]